jgi:hypothetical protein
LQLIEDGCVLVAGGEFLPVPNFLLDLSSSWISFFAVGVGAIIEEALESLGELPVGRVGMGQILDTARFFYVYSQIRFFWRNSDNPRWPSVLLM